MQLTEQAAEGRSNVETTGEEETAEEEPDGEVEQVEEGAEAAHSFSLSISRRPQEVLVVSDSKDSDPNHFCKKSAAD